MNSAIVRFYRDSILANAISVFGTFLDVFAKVFGVVCIIFMFVEIGTLQGIACGILALAVFALLGVIVRKAVWKLADLVMVNKIKREYTFA